MLAYDAASAIESRIPREWAEDWDNVGLVIGDGDRDVSRIVVALDATPDVIEGAAAGSAMLVVHHPPIFRAMKDFSRPSPQLAVLASAIKAGVCVYAAHTNWDSSPEGVNAVLAHELGLRGVRPIVPSSRGAWGMGAIGDLDREISSRDLARRIRGAWGLSWAALYGDDAPVRRVALCGGSGGDFADAARSSGADIFITADMSYHEIEDARAMGLSIVDVGHGEMESASLDALAHVVSSATGLEASIADVRDRAPFFVI